MATASSDPTIRRHLSLSYEELATPNQLSPTERRVWDAARAATDHSYAPYSHFHVGAALLLADDTLVQGTNQENAAYPSGLCAERTALFGLAGGRPTPPPRIVGMSVAGRPATGDFCPALPCGACRQVMLEYELRQGQPIWLLLPSVDGTILRFERLADLLPFHFSAEALPPRA
ncbi:cytidine deaminase [Hymenobacter sp. UV11]|uniref:cytidine deaminase n=1 Tax=Hymenobacter sp. UV11 TaxID=1849735 RepID=UPI00105F1DA8|nr:cytidine deaminase [Hymenobacter sp. UV11]TDN40357.1 cytidine deaminase [Hymenobacter sp. UV11]TFZ66641.1 cytidine deaminase [Hymenobacter sp. UV11]